jgi:hypothetical protein
MRSTSRTSSLFFFSFEAASSGLADSVKAATRNTSFHMRQASRCAPAAAVRLCNELFPPLHLAVGFIDVAPQLVALLGGELARALGTLRAALAIAVRFADVVAHALALVVFHVALRPLVLLAPLLLGERGPGAKDEREQKR